MIITASIIVLALLALLFLLRLAKGQAAAVRQLYDLQNQLRPVDVEAFQNLTSPAEEEFLRSQLSPAEFRKIHRLRLRAALEYITCAAHNAAVLVRMGEAARRSSDPVIVEAGEKLVDSAVRLRLFALQARAKLYVGIIFPGTRNSAHGLAENYERMARQVRVLGRLQDPIRGVSAFI